MKRFEYSKLTIFFDAIITTERPTVISIGTMTNATNDIKSILEIFKIGKKGLLVIKQF